MGVFSTNPVDCIIHRRHRNQRCASLQTEPDCCCLRAYPRLPKGHLGSRPQRAVHACPATLGSERHRTHRPWGRSPILLALAWLGQTVFDLPAFFLGHEEGLAHSFQRFPFSLFQGMLLPRKTLFGFCLPISSSSPLTKPSRTHSVRHSPLA